MSGKEYEEALKQFIETARSDVHAAILALVRATSPCGGTKGGAAGLELLEATGYSKPVVVEKLAVALTQHLKGRLPGLTQEQRAAMLRTLVTEQPVNKATLELIVALMKSFDPVRDKAVFALFAEPQALNNLSPAHVREMEPALQQALWTAAPQRFEGDVLPPMLRFLQQDRALSSMTMFASAARIPHAVHHLQAVLENADLYTSLSNATMMQFRRTHNPLYVMFRYQLFLLAAKQHSAQVAAQQAAQAQGAGTDGKEAATRRVADMSLSDPYKTVLKHALNFTLSLKAEEVMALVSAVRELVRQCLPSSGAAHAAVAVASDAVPGNKLVRSGMRSKIKDALDTLRATAVEVSPLAEVFFRPALETGVLKDAYLRTISPNKPMDYSTMASHRLSKYESWDDARRDARIIFENSRAFNGEASAYTQCAKALADRFDSLLSAAEMQGQKRISPADITALLLEPRLVRACVQYILTVALPSACELGVCVYDPYDKEKGPLAAPTVLAQTKRSAALCCLFVLALGDLALTGLSVPAPAPVPTVVGAGGGAAPPAAASVQHSSTVASATVSPLTANHILELLGPQATKDARSAIPVQPSSLPPHLVLTCRALQVMYMQDALARAASPPAGDTSAPPPAASSSADAAEPAAAATSAPPAPLPVTLSESEACCAQPQVLALLKHLRRGSHLFGRTVAALATGFIGFHMRRPTTRAAWAQVHVLAHVAISASGENDMNLPLTLAAAGGAWLPGAGVPTGSASAGSGAGAGSGGGSATPTEAEVSDLALATALFKGLLLPLAATSSHYAVERNCVHRCVMFLLRDLVTRQVVPPATAAEWLTDGLKSLLPPETWLPGTTRSSVPILAQTQAALSSLVPASSMLPLLDAGWLSPLAIMLGKDDFAQGYDAYNAVLSAKPEIRGMLPWEELGLLPSAIHQRVLNRAAQPSAAGTAPYSVSPTTPMTGVPYTPITTSLMTPASPLSPVSMGSRTPVM